MWSYYETREVRDISAGEDEELQHRLEESHMVVSSTEGRVTQSRETIWKDLCLAWAIQLRAWRAQGGCW